MARAIFACRTPVISAVGHETDFTIADMVADKRAATPSQAAEFAVPARSDLETRLAFFHTALRQKLFLYLEHSRGRLRKAREHRLFQQPGAILRERIQTLDYLEQRLETAFFERYRVKKTDCQLLREKLGVLSPLHTLERGYSICLKGNRLLKTAAEVSTGDAVEVRLAKGTICCEVKHIEGGDRQYGKEEGNDI